MDEDIDTEVKQRSWKREISWKKFEEQNKGMNMTMDTKITADTTVLENQFLKFCKVIFSKN